VHDMGVAELAAALKARALSSREATQALLERIRSLDPALGAFLHVDADGALARAAAADAALAAGTAGPLTGIPLAHKDIY
uniref:amidase family protein n=1 Tax=Klebsiella aerogenes TaxID=548 RepID=UPI0022311BF5